MDYPKFILSYKKVEFIGTHRVNAYKEVSKSTFFSFDVFNVIKRCKCLFKYKKQDARYKKFYFPSVIVQQITLATRAIFRHNRCKK